MPAIGFNIATFFPCRPGQLVGILAVQYCIELSHHGFSQPFESPQLIFQLRQFNLRPHDVRVTGGGADVFCQRYLFKALYEFEVLPGDLYCFCQIDILVERVFDLEKEFQLLRLIASSGRLGARLFASRSA